MIEPDFDADPVEVWRCVRADQTAALALWFGLAGLEVGFAAAVDHASTPCDCCPDDVGLAYLPAAVFRAANGRLIGDARRALDGPDIRAAAVPVPTCCARSRPVVESRVWRIINRIRDTITDAEIDDLRLRCVDGDHDAELRYLRAGFMFTIGQISDDAAMTSAAVEMALRECYERRFSGLTPAAVWSVAAPVVWRIGRDIAPDTLAALLRAELARIDSLMLYPDADVGGAP